MIIFIHSLIIVYYKNMTLKELEIENQRLVKIFEEMIDYHHHIGNDDCPYSTNTILVHLYKLAEEGLENQM